MRNSEEDQHFDAKHNEDEEEHIEAFDMQKQEAEKGKRYCS